MAFLAFSVLVSLIGVVTTGSMDSVIPWLQWVGIGTIGLFALGAGTRLVFGSVKHVLIGWYDLTETRAEKIANLDLNRSRAIGDIHIPSENILSERQIEERTLARLSEFAHQVPIRGTQREAWVGGRGKPSYRFDDGGPCVRWYYDQFMELFKICGGIVDRKQGRSGEVQ